MKSFMGCKDNREWRIENGEWRIADMGFEKVGTTDSRIQGLPGLQHGVLKKLTTDSRIRRITRMGAWRFEKVH